MENVVSIFSGQFPCDNLNYSNEEFYEFICDGSQERRDHLSNCRECFVRLGVLARQKINNYNLATLTDIYDD